ncbi:hypothetical protein BJS_03473 [Bradyrhizobium japonicum SEMIA 5079]|nr:hypothetical protein BJS_03473 [Bradyrhizobium japonicum SEMIA 5079]
MVEHALLAAHARPAQGAEIGSATSNYCSWRFVRQMTGSFCSIAFANTVPLVRPSSFAISAIGLVPARTFSLPRSSSLHACFQRAISPIPRQSARARLGL